MPYKILKIDGLTRGDHFFLEEHDDCYHVMLYHAHLGFGHGPENDRFQNFKKPMDRRGLGEFKYKIHAIHEIAQILKETVTENDLKGITIVPIPPSRVKTDPDYDNRVEKVIEKLTRGYNADVRELLVLTENYEPAHLAGDGDRLKPSDYEKLYKVNNSLTDPVPRTKIKNKSLSAPESQGAVHGCCTKIEVTCGKSLRGLNLPFFQ